MERGEGASSSSSDGGVGVGSGRGAWGDGLKTMGPGGWLCLFERRFESRRSGPGRACWGGMPSLGVEGGDRESLFDSWDMNESTVMTCQSAVSHLVLLFWTCRRDIDAGHEGGEFLVIGGHPATEHPRPHPPTLRCTALLLLHGEARFPDRGIGASGPIVRAPPGLEGPSHHPSRKAREGSVRPPSLCLCLCSCCALKGQGMPGACGSQGGRHFATRTTGIQHVFAIWAHTSILSGHLGSLPLCFCLCLSALGSRLSLFRGLAGGGFGAWTLGPSVVSCLALGGRQQGIAAGGRRRFGRRVLDGGRCEESQDNTGRRDGPYVNEGRGGHSNIENQETRRRVQAGLRFGGSVGFFLVSCWTGTSRLDSYQDSRALQGCGIVVWAVGR
jgi:hypothetical protein